MDLLNVFLVSLPSLDWALRLLNVPEVDEFALAGNSDMFVILPFDFEASEIWIDVAMVETGNFLQRIRVAIPDRNDAEESACGHEISSLSVELRIHQDVVETLDFLDLYLPLIVNLPYPRYHVGRTC